MTAAEFRPLFERVCSEFGLSAEARAVAWDSCHAVAADGTPYIRKSAVSIYRQIDGTRGPWRAQG